MTFELGVYSFGNTSRTAEGEHGPTAQAVRDVLEAVRLAEEVGLDFFGFGEHHTRSMPLSSPTSLVTAAAASTQRIKLGTTVTVLSTDEPLRVFQQLATAAAIGPGRIEAVAGRGSSAITFPLSSRGTTTTSPPRSARSSGATSSTSPFRRSNTCRPSSMPVSPSNWLKWASLSTAASAPVRSLTPTAT
jgi:hypothetical protein